MGLQECSREPSTFDLDAIFDAASTTTTGSPHTIEETLPAATVVTRKP
eukprot:CAMPEP_0174731312 /NCGR_PEP_ID=MMETSP1094-20130205/57280_1 /TAXON_ID=156173 /ORGANISM="Chrysochromulina brevifilum, Strain UTEX LB 985" /LENGTH=47 /DNA_ID= /DNA_START= /DNA_END= /DNA_ORIENTATION=